MFGTCVHCIDGRVVGPAQAYLKERYNLDYIDTTRDELKAENDTLHAIINKLPLRADLIRPRMDELESQLRGARLNNAPVVAERDELNERCALQGAEIARLRKALALAGQAGDDIGEATENALTFSADN